MALVPFTIPPRGQGAITVDGKDIHGVTGYALTWCPQDGPRLTLDLSVLIIEPVEGEAQVYVTERARNGLLALGWTPPEDETKEG